MADEKVGVFLSPEGIIIMFVAICTDVAGALVGLIPVVGWIINIIIVISATLFFLIWGWFRKNTRVVERRAAVRRGAVRATRAARGLAKMSKTIKWLKWIRPIVEFIPYVNILPLWSISAYLELKYS